MLHLVFQGAYCFSCSLKLKLLMCFIVLILVQHKAKSTAKSLLLFCVQTLSADLRL